MARISGQGGRASTCPDLAAKPLDFQDASASLNPSDVQPGNDEDRPWDTHVRLPAWSVGIHAAPTLNQKHSSCLVCSDLFEPFQISSQVQKMWKWQFYGRQPLQASFASHLHALLQPVACRLCRRGGPKRCASFTSFFLLFPTICPLQSFGVYVLEALGRSILTLSHLALTFICKIDVSPGLNVSYLPEL